MQKAVFQVGLKKFLFLQKLKIVFRGHVINAFNGGAKLLERFKKENCKKQVKKSLELKK